MFTPHLNRSVLFLGLTVSPLSAALVFDLGFTSLPNAQPGIGFSASGPHQGRSAGDLFASNGTALLQDTTVDNTGTPGIALFDFSLPTPTANQTYSLTVQTAVTSEELSDPQFDWAAHAFELNFASGRMAFGMNSSQLFILETLQGGAVRSRVVDISSTGADLTANNTYVLDVNPTADSFGLFLNGTSVASGALVASAPVASTSINRLRFGDGTGFANAVATTQQVTLETTSPVPEPSTTLITGFLGVSALFVRRRRSLTA